MKKTKSKKPGKRAKTKAGSARSGFWSRVRAPVIRIAKWAAIAVGIWVALVLVLMLAYKIPFIHPVSTLMIAEGVRGNGARREWVELDKINPVLVNSVMVSEDAKFCAHGGIDWEAVNSVIDNALDGERTRGASTISMQTVKNMFLWNGRSYVRKMLELPLAGLADFVWGKRRMMEIYLNVAEWDTGVFGIGAASRHYFKRSPDRLSARQSALLAVTLPNPKGRNPAKARKGLRRLALRIERRAYQSGAYIKCLKP